MKNWIIKKFGKKSHDDTLQENGLINRKYYATLFRKKIMYKEVFNLMLLKDALEKISSATGFFDPNADYILMESLDKLEEE